MNHNKNISPNKLESEYFSYLYFQFLTKRKKNYDAKFT